MLAVGERSDLYQHAGQMHVVEHSAPMMLMKVVSILELPPPPVRYGKLTLCQSEGCRYGVSRGGEYGNAEGDDVQEG